MLLLKEDPASRSVTKHCRGKVWDKLAKDTDNAGEGQLALSLCNDGLDDAAVGGGDIVSLRTISCNVNCDLLCVHVVPLATAHQ
jgi:hypothetical protein